MMMDLQSFTMYELKQALDNAWDGWASADNDDTESIFAERIRAVKAEMLRRWEQGER
jgi:hypothetical protein